MVFFGSHCRRNGWIDVQKDEGCFAFLFIHFINRKYIYLYWNANCHPFILFNCLLENQFDTSIIATRLLFFVYTDMEIEQDTKTFMQIDTNTSYYLGI